MTEDLVIMCKLLLDNVPAGSDAVLLDFPSNISSIALPSINSKLPLVQDPRGGVEIVRDILATESLASKFETHLPEAVRLYKGLPGTISEGHAWLATPANWVELYPWESFMRIFRQIQMANGKPALFILPWLPIDYNKYFNQMWMITVSDFTAYKEDEAFKAHIAEEGIVSKLEFDLFHTQRAWRKNLINTQTWQVKNLTV